MDLSFRLINAFAASDEPFSGNAICVFEGASGLHDDHMRQLTQQLNVECVFVQSSTPSTADIRIVVPSAADRLSASSILSAAHVVSRLHGQSQELLFDVRGAKVKARPAGQSRWTIPAGPAVTRELDSPPQILSSLVGLSTTALSGDVMVVESTRSGIVLPVGTVEDVRRTRLDARMLQSYAMLHDTEPQVYVWAYREDGAIESRMFHGPSGGLIELAATGSGAANLGAWLAAHGQYGSKLIYQGEAVGRPSLVDLEIKESGQVLIGGRVNEVATGTFTL